MEKSLRFRALFALYILVWLSLGLATGYFYLLSVESSNPTNNPLLYTLPLVVLSIFGCFTFCVLIQQSRKQAEKEGLVNNANSLIQGFFESSQSGIMVLKAIRDLANQIIDLEWLAVNKKGCDFINTTPAALIGKRLLTVAPIHASNGLFETYKTCIETKKPIELDTAYTLSSGKTLWLNISASPIDDGVAITFTDISSRMTAAKQLQESEANLKALINNTADEVWSVDRNLKMISANDAFRERAKPAETTPVWTAILNRALAGERFEEEITIPSKSGKQRLMHYYFSPVAAKDGSIQGVAVYGQDVTEKKNTEAKVNHQSKLLNTILNNIPMVVFTLDNKGFLENIEGLALEIYELEASKILGQNMIDLYPQHKAEIEKSLKGEPSHFTWRGNGNPTKRYFDAYLFPSTAHGSQVTGVALDITPLKSSQIALEEQKRKAEEVSAFKTRFLANMSHEIRTPLSAILGFTEILMREETDTRHIEFLNHIENSGKNLLKIIGDILDLTKIEEGKMTLIKESFNLKEAVADALEPYKFKAKEKGLEFDLVLEDSIPDSLLGDIGKIIQILINLVGNAIKFTTEGGITVHIDAKLSSVPNVAILLFTITDSGIGVAEEKQLLIFDAFSQGEAGMSRKYGGSGLGLSIASSMVRLLGGNLRLISPTKHTYQVSDPGSKFYFSLPIPIDNEAAPQNSLRFPYDRVSFQGRYHLPLVEDNAVNQRLAELVLQDTGCTIEFATNGNEALELIQEKSFDLVFMDVQMPVLDGLSATRIIRKFDTKTPIVGLSANVYKEDIEACLQAGMTNFLAKPYTREKFLAIVAEYVPQTASILYANYPAAKPKTKEPILGSNKYPEINFDMIASLFGADDESRQAFMLSIRDSFSAFLLTSQELSPANWAVHTPTTAKAIHKIKPNFELIGLAPWNQRASLLEKSLEQPFSDQAFAEVQKMQDVVAEACALLEQGLAQLT